MNVGDAVLEDLPKSSPPPKKNTAEPKLVLVSSSGEPSGPKRHVSLKILALCDMGTKEEVKPNFRTPPR
jgi:hypothetical protein